MRPNFQIVTPTVTEKFSNKVYTWDYGSFTIIAFFDWHQLERIVVFPYRGCGCHSTIKGDDHRITDSDFANLLSGIKEVAQHTLRVCGILH